MFAITFHGFPNTIALLFLSLVILLVEFVSAGPSNKISWVPYAEVADSFSSIIPGGWNSEKPAYIVRTKDTKTDNSIWLGRFLKSQGTIYTISRGDDKRELKHPENETRDPDFKVEFLKYPKGVLQWVYVEGSRVPINSMVPGGYIADTEELLYICRITVVESNQLHVVPGMYQDSVGTCKVGWGGTAVSNVREHEVLILSSYGRALGATVPKLNKQ